VSSNKNGKLLQVGFLVGCLSGGVTVAQDIFTTDDFRQDRERWAEGRRRQAERAEEEELEEISRA